MCDAANKAARRLIKWRDSAQRQLSAASCSEDLSSALQFVLRNAAKALRAVLRSNDDDRLSRDLSDVLCHVSSHLYVRSRDLLAGDCSSRFDYWEHQCAVLSYLLDLSLVREDPAAITKICFVLSKNKHMVWDVLVQTSAISSASEPQLSKLLELFRRFAAYCPRTCASAALYLKFVVCAACLAKRLPGRGWKTVKPVVLSIEPVEFDFVEWFVSQPPLIALVHESGVPACRGKLIARLCKGTSEPAELLEACRRTLADSGGGYGGIRKTCDAEAAAEVDMFAIADEVPEREESTMIAEVEDEQLQKILDSTLSRVRSTIAAPHASDAEPNSEINSDASNSPLNTKAFLDRLLRCSVADTGSGEVLKEVASPAKKLDNGQQETVEEVNSREAEEVVEVAPAKGYEHTSMAQETSGGVAGNCVDSTSATLPPRKRRRRRKRVRSARAPGKLHGFVEANGGQTTPNAAEESDACAPSMDDEVENKAVSPHGAPLRKHVQELCSVSVAQDTGAAAMLNGSRQGVKTTKQHNASDLVARSCQLTDAEIDGEVSMKVTEEPPYPLNSQDEPLTKSPEKASPQRHGSDKAALPADTGGSVNPPCSEVCTAESGLLCAREARKSTKSRRPRVIESSTEESCDEQELSSVSVVRDVSTARTLKCDQHEVKMTEHNDKLGDLEEMSCEHHGAKTRVKMSLTKGREKHGEHIDDSTESFSSSSGDEVAPKSDGQPLRDNATKTVSSSSGADNAVEGSEQSHREDATVTRLNSDAEPICEVSSSSSKFEFLDDRLCRQGTSGGSFKKSPVALSPDRKCSRLTSTPIAETFEDKEGHRKTTSHSPEPEVKNSKDLKANLKSKKTFEAHSDSEYRSSAKLEDVQHLPAMTVKAEYVPTVSTVKKTRRTRIVISSDTSDEEHTVQHLALESETSEEEYRDERAAGLSETLVRGLNLFSSESSDDHSAAHLTQQRAESSDEEGIVEHSAEEAKFSDEESSIEYPPLQEAKSSDERAISEHSRQDTEPPDQGTVKHSAVQEGHCYETSNGAYSAPQEAESSGEEGIVEHAIPQEADLSDGEAVVGLSRQDAESSEEGDSAKLTAMGEESSNKKVEVEHPAPQEVESSDEEGSNGHAAQPEAGQPAVFSEFVDEIPCGQQSPSASSLQNMHFSPLESDRGGSLSPVIQATSHQAAESDADTLELQSNDELVASGRQRGAHLSQATTVSVSSQRRSPSPFSKLRELVMSFGEDSDDETDVPGFRRTAVPSSLPQSSFKVPPVKKLGTYTALTSVKSKHQNKRCSSNERSSPSKKQPARSIVCSRDAVSPRGKQRAVSCKRKVSESDSDSASAVTSDTANVSSNSHVMGSRNVAVSKSKDLGLGKRKASIRNNSSRTSLPTEKFTKLPKSIETSESEGSSASGSDSGECHRDGNKALEPAKHNKESSSKAKKGLKVKGSPPNRRKNSPHPKPLALDPSLPGRAALKSPSNHDSGGASVTVNKDNSSSEHSRQNNGSARQVLEAESVVSTRRRSTRSSARRLAFEQENDVCKSNSGSTSGKDDSDLTVQSNNIAKKPPKGKRILNNSKYANSTPEKPSAPVSYSHAHITHDIAPSTRSSVLTGSGIKCDASGKHPCPNSPVEKPLSSMTGQTPETVAESTSRSGQPTSASGNEYSSSPIRSTSPAYGVMQVGQANLGVLTRSARARKQLTYVDGNTSPSGGRMAKSLSVGEPDKSYGKCRDTRMTSRLPEDLELARIEAETRVLQDHVDSVARRDFSPTQGEDAISEGEYESGNKSIDSSSPRVTKIPAVVLHCVQSDEAEPAATVSGNQNLPRTRSVPASPQGQELEPPNTSVEVSGTSKRQLVRTKSGHNAGLSRLPSRTPSKRRRVSDASISVMPALEATEDDVPRMNDDLRGLTQAPLLRNVNYSSDPSSSDGEGKIVRTAEQQRRSLRRLPSRRLPLHTKKEDFIIDVDEAIRSLSDISDDDPSYKVRNEVNLEASIARLRTLKVPLYTKQERGQSGPPSATSSYNVSGTNAKRTGRLSLAAIQASQRESSVSNPSGHSPPFSQVSTTSNGIAGLESPTSSLYAHQSPHRRTRSCRGGLTGAVTEKQTEHLHSPPQSKVNAPSMSGDLGTVAQTNTEMSAKQMPVLRRSTRVSVKQDTLVQHTHSNLSGIEGPAAATQMSQDLEITEEQTLHSTKRNTNSKMSSSSQILAEHPTEMLDAAEEASLMDEASSTTCSTCIRCANAPSTQDSGTMTDDSYLHDEEAFSNSPMSSKRKKTAVRPASASQPKAQAPKSSQRQGAATQESRAPVRRSTRISTGVLRRLSYA